MCVAATVATYDYSVNRARGRQDEFWAESVGDSSLAGEPGRRLAT
jgi:hypothetical protein